VPCEGYKTSFRSHLVWAKRRNVNLKELMTQKCLKNTTVVALIVNTDMAILYNPSEVGNAIREGLKNGNVDTLAFWTGFSTCFSVSKDTQCVTRVCYRIMDGCRDDEASNELTVLRYSFVLLSSPWFPTTPPIPFSIH
jgi:hypothetical protein